MIIGRKVILKDEVASTNDLAKQLALEGEEEGTVVVAKRQTAGRGRQGRIWVSPDGGVYLSVILRPKVAVGEMLRLTVQFCVPVASSVEAVTGRQARLKWPNDVEVEGKKVAGILVEAASRGADIPFLILGIGINLNTRQDELEGENPGSLSAITGTVYDQEAFLHQLLFHLDRFYGSFLKGEADLDEYRKRSSTLDRHVVGSVGDQHISGRAMYLDEQGALIIKGDDGLTYRLDSVYQLRYA